MIANDGTLIRVVRPTKQQYPIREMTLTDVFLQPKETEAEDGNLSLDLILYIVWASLQKQTRFKDLAQGLVKMHVNRTKRRLVSCSMSERIFLRLPTFGRDPLAGIQGLGAAHSTSWDLTLP